MQGLCITSLAAFTRVLWLILFLGFTPFATAANVIELSVHGSIGPATADYVLRGIDKGQKAELILIEMDTPGGLDKSMRQIVSAILASATPVVVYIAPSGARAASAGTYLLYASTVAVMAPGTHLGAASPVNLGAPMDEEAKSETKTSTMHKKATNDAVAYIRTLAQLRGRNMVFAEKAVLDAATMTAQEALKNKVIDFIAKDKEELFIKLQGITVTQAGHSIQLNTESVKIEKIEPDWRMRFLLVITDPTLAYLLLLLGIYGIFFELVNPGFIVPGVIGALAMVVALYALQLLPINYAGLALITLGIVFIVAEVFVPSFGALGLGGTFAFILGSIFLIDSQAGGYQIARSAIWGMAVVNLLVFIAFLSMAVRSRRKPLQHGMISLLGAEGRALNAIHTEGQAVISGEIWNVYAQTPINAGKRVKVIAAQGLKLEVEEIKGE